MRRKTQAQKTSNTAATGQLLHDAISRDAANSALPMIHDVLNSPGQSLDPATHAFIKPSFGHDFSQVRVHTDHKAAESARSINALAYTVGQDIVFGAGQFAPKELSGMRLLAHELTHVSQNRGRPPGGTTQLGIDSPHSPAEHEAFLASRFIHAGITAKSIQQ